MNQIIEPENSSKWIGDARKGSHINFNDHLRWDVFSREFDKLSVFLHLERVSTFFNSWHVGCCASQHPRGCAVEFDSTVSRAGTLYCSAQYLDICAEPVFSLVFLSQSCSVFVNCDISTVTVLVPWFKGAPLLQFVFAQQKNMYHTIFMCCTIT